MDVDLSLISFFGFVEDVDVVGVKIIILRSGYIGEDGFEIYMLSVDVGKVFEVILVEGVVLIGLGVWDILCLEVVFVFYG